MLDHLNESFGWLAFADVIFTSERCNRVTYGLRTVNGDPSRYKQCGPSGRVWIVPCAPQMTFDPEDRVCKERADPKVFKSMRKYELAKNIITTPPPSYHPGSITAAASPPGAAAPEEFVFSTLRPKSRKPKTRTRTGKTRKTTTPMMVTTESSALIETTTPKIVIFASKKSASGGNRSGEQLKQQLIRDRAKNHSVFPRPGRPRTTPTPVTHATRFVVGPQMSTVAVKEVQGMPHTLPPYEKMERRKEIENLATEDVTTMTPEYTVKYNGKTMTENEFLNQLLHIVQHQKAINERQQQEKFEKMEQERLRQEKEELAREVERRRKLEEAEKARQAAMEKQAAIYAEHERLAMERERELDRIRQEDRKRELEQIRQQELAVEMERMRELERLQMERQQKNERVRQELEAARKVKILEKERQRVRAEQENARQREVQRLEEEREREMERVRLEEQERQQQVERLRQDEAERRRKKLEKEKEDRKRAEEQRRKILEQELEARKRAMIEEERKRKLVEKEMEERQKAIAEEERRREAEEERRTEQEMEERRRIQEQMRKATEERSRLEAMEKEREMMRQIVESEKARAEYPVATPPTTIKPIYRPRPVTSEYQPPDVESHMIRFTTQSPEWATPAPANWQPEWTEENAVHREPCDVNGECELKYDSDSFCVHPSNPSMYLQCAPLYGRLGRWTERHCPDTLIFLVRAGRCEKDDQRRPYDPDNRVVIPRLPSETSFVEWEGNRVIDNVPNSVSPPRVYPPVPDTYPSQIYNTIDEFPRDLLPRLPEVTPEETYAQQYQNSLKSEIDLSHIHPLFPRVQPDFLSRILPSLNLKLHDDNAGQQSLGSVVKPVIKQIALNQTEHFLDRLLADQQLYDEQLRQEIIDRLKSSNIEGAMNQTSN
uniref:Chitin-binding type-2 domain-containing protein n=1 Tax=Caenorhabditis japonica TaxID=281687 RepID=A0A8R1HQ29_CAEJA